MAKRPAILSRLCLRFVVIAILGIQPAVAQEFQAGPGISGAWYDPARDGEGWLVEVLADGRAVVYWFTYPPSGGEGSNAWVVGTGRVEGDSIVITESVINRGARFGAAFDSNDLVSETWGTWTMTFSDCDRGEIRFQGPPGFGSGEYQLARLGRIQGSPCGGGEHDPSVTGFSGSWYDPETDGQGVILGILPDSRVLLYWFTFDPEGNQQWLLGIGTTTGVRVEFPEVFAFAGTAFGNAFDTSEIVATVWGSLSITFDQCDQGTLNYRGPDESWGAGSMRLTRLSKLAAHPCQLADNPPANKGSWGASIPMNPGLSEVATAVLDDRAYVAGDLGGSRAFLRFDPARGRFTRLKDLPSHRHHATLLPHEGDLYLMGGRTEDKDVYRYDVQMDRWRHVISYPIPFGYTAGVAVGSRILAFGQTGAVFRLHPAEPRWESIARGPQVLEDHAAVVAYRGEVWLLGGRGSNAEGLPNTNAVNIFDPVTRVWRTGPFMRQARSGFAATVVDGQIMVAGGEDLQGPAPSLIGSLEVYSPGEGWVLGPSIPEPVHGVGGASLGGRFYLLGGSDVAGVAGSPGFSQVYIPGS